MDTSRQVNALHRLHGAVFAPPLLGSLAIGAVVSSIAWLAFAPPHFGGDFVGQIVCQLIAWIGTSSLVHLLWRRTRIRRDVLLTGAVTRFLHDLSVKPEADADWFADIDAYACSLDRKRGERGLLPMRCRTLARAESTRAGWRATATLSSELDRREKETGFAATRFMIWSLPMLGFIGTVIGISGAIRSFSLAMGGTEAATEVAQALKDRIPDVTTQLSLAFDTTLLGLVFSIVAMCVQTWLEQDEDRYLDALDDVWHGFIAPTLAHAPRAEHGTVIVGGAADDPTLETL